MVTKILIIAILALPAVVNAQAGIMNGTIAETTTIGEIIKPYNIALSTDPLRSLLSFLKTNPAPDVLWDQKLPSPLNASIPPRVVEIFRSIEVAVFGRPGVLKLVPADLSGPAECLPGSKTVLISPEFSEFYLKQGKTGENQLTFILAHELGHYIVEVFNQLQSPNGLSPNGLPSRKKFQASNEGMYNPNEPAVSLAKLFIDRMGPQADSHAEVDVIGFLVMDLMNFTLQDELKAMQAGLQLTEDAEVNISVPNDHLVGPNTEVVAGLSLQNPAGLTWLGDNVMHLEPMIRYLVVKTTFANSVKPRN